MRAVEHQDVADTLHLHGTASFPDLEAQPPLLLPRQGRQADLDQLMAGEGLLDGGEDRISETLLSELHHRLQVMGALAQETHLTGL